MYKVESCLLLDILHKKDMSQSELAARLKIPKQRIYEYTSNRVVMSYQIAYSIAEILQCDMSDLYRMSYASKE